MSGQYGIDSLIKVIDFGIELGNISGKALEDKKINISDIPLLVSLFDEFTSLSSVNWKDLPKEVSEIDPDEKNVIALHFADKLDIPQKDIEDKIEHSLSLALSAIALAIEIKDLVKSFKKQEVQA